MWQKQIFTNFQLLLPLPFVVMFPGPIPTSSLGQAPALQTHCPDLGEQPEFFSPSSRISGLSFHKSNTNEEGAALVELLSCCTV